MLFILLAVQAGLSLASPLENRAAAATDYSAEVIATAKSLQSVWYSQKTGLWGNAWWNSGNALTTLADFTKLRPQQAASLNLTAIIHNTFQQAQKTNVKTTKATNQAGIVESSNCIDGKNTDGSTCESSTGEKELNTRGFSKFLNEFYDDEGWWALGLIHAFDATNNRDYLNAAVEIFKDMQTGLGGPCKGGIYWSKERKYVNAVANELYLSVAASLATRVSAANDKSRYLQIAKSQWDWFSRSGMINSRNLINDGLTSDCKNNGRDTWIYNQGVILGGLTALYRATNDKMYLEKATVLANAAIGALTNANGVLIEANKCDAGVSRCSHDLEQFKGIFVRNLRYLHEAAPSNSFKTFILKNADAVWKKDRSSDNRLGVSWDGPYLEASVMTHSSAMDALVAAVAVA